ncbi:MAG: tetratricopeptide repeat protein, partial [Candidatus Brocadiales bacterium]
DNAILLTQGQKALESGNANEAIELFSKVRNTNPIEEAALCGIGLASQMKGKTDEAIDAFKKAIEINPSFYNAYQSLALAYKDANQIDNARVCLEKAALCNAYASNQLHRALELHNAGDIEPAIRQIEKLLPIEPNNSCAHNDIAVLYYQQGKRDKALLHLQRSVALDVNDITAMRNLAYLYFDRKDYSKATSACEAVLLKDFKDADTLVLLSNCYLEMNACEAALIGYQKALELSPKHKDAKKGMALVKARLKNNGKQKSCTSLLNVPEKPASISGKILHGEKLPI